MATNLADVVRESASDRPAHIALIDGDRRITYAGLDDQIDAVARGLLGVGLAQGDRVVLVLGNRAEFVVALFAVVRAGGVAVPLNTSSTATEIEHAVATAGAGLLLTDVECAAGVGEADLAGCRTIVATSAGWGPLHSSAGSAGGAGFPDVDPSSVAVLLFTAGSTGRPKAAMLTHSSLLANVTAMLELTDPPALTPEDISLAVLPLFHVYSLNAVLVLSMAVGATVVLTRRFSAKETLDVIGRHGVTVVAGAPPMYVAWSAEPNLREALAPVRLLLSGAAPLPPEIFAQFRTVAGLPIWEGYGLTECSPVVTTSLVNGEPKAGSVGAPLSNVELRIVPGTAEPGEDMDEDDDETGQIWVRGPSVFAGYWPDGTGGPDDRGWFGTGDIGYLDAAGCLHLVARRADLILVSGFNVYPREVEQVVEGMAGVRECAVIGVEHPYSGEAVKALIVADEGAAITDEDVVTWCLARLARFKCPTIVEIVSELPHGVTGKLARGRLR